MKEFKIIEIPRQKFKTMFGTDFSDVEALLEEKTAVVAVRGVLMCRQLLKVMMIKFALWLLYVVSVNVNVVNQN